jgi:hypothetical protein
LWCEYYQPIGRRILEYAIVFHVAQITRGEAAVEENQ